MSRGQQGAVQSAAVLGVVCVLGCSKPSAPPERTSNAALETAPATSAKAAEPCIPCDRPSTRAFVFVGDYIDSHCTQPIVHADIVACAPVEIGSKTLVTYEEPFARRKAGERVATKLVRQATATEVSRMFQKRGGKCAPFDAQGFKLAPTGCEGKKVCRNATGDLACSNCRLLNDGCPDYVPTRVFAIAGN